MYGDVIQNHEFLQVHLVLQIRLIEFVVQVAENPRIRQRSKPDNATDVVVILGGEVVF